MERLDRNLRHLADVIRRDLGKDILTLPGGGAAGGMGAGAAAFWNGTLRMGIETVLDTVKFDDLLRGARLVITGEGRLDSQSLRGKVISGVAVRAARAGVPVAAIVGAVGEGADGIYHSGICCVRPTTNRSRYTTAKLHAEENMQYTIRNLMGFLLAGGGVKDRIEETSLQMPGKLV